MAEEYDPIESVLDRAMEFASERNHEYVVLEHLLLAKEKINISTCHVPCCVQGKT